MKTSESIKQLATALLAAQGAFSGVVKDKTNPHFKSKYADLQAAIVATEEPLRANGLLVIQTPRGCVATQSATVVTRLLHSSGEWIEDELELPAGTNQRCDAQTFGSAITYARRYSYLGILGIAPEDDDGNVASGHAGAAITRPFTVVTKPGFVTAAVQQGDAFEEDPLFDENGDIIESKATVQHREQKQAVPEMEFQPASGNAVGIPRGKRFVAIALGNGRDWKQIGAIFKQMGIEKADQIPVNQYDQIISWAGGKNEKRA